jgi:class 3 adenylate cyclase/alpha-beta hydrolase superfamily lysophospholipase
VHHWKSRKLPIVEVPDIQYVRSGDVAVAYQVLGEGPVDVVWFRGMAGDLLSTWDEPLILRHARDLATFSRLLMFDKRGTGLSDRVREAPTLETRMDDVRAVMDVAGSERAVLWTAHEGSRTALLFAATYPERTAGLVLLEPSVRGTGSAEYPWAPDEEDWRRRLSSVREGWGQRTFFAELLRDWAPSLVDDDAFEDWFTGHMRRSLSPGAALSFFRTMKEADVGDILSSVGVPTLILCKPKHRAEADYVAERLSRSEIAELPGLDGLFTWVDDEVHEQTIRETERFLTRMGRPPEADRVLATVLFTDIVGSTKRASELGNAAWRALLERHHALVRSRLGQFRGDEIDTAGDGFFAAFDGPRRAIECALALVDDVRSLGLEIRAGLHTGECELMGKKPSGIAVAIGARVAEEAKPGEVLVSSTVKDLVAGSEITFEDRGSHELKGVGEWRLYGVSAGPVSRDLRRGTA